MLIDFLLRQKCRVRPWLRMENGVDVYGEAQERACRLQKGLHLENGISVDGVEDAVTAKALMFCTGAAIPERSLVDCEGKKLHGPGHSTGHGAGDGLAGISLRGPSAGKQRETGGFGRRKGIGCRDERRGKLWGFLRGCAA